MSGWAKVTHPDVVKKVYLYCYLANATGLVTFKTHTIMKTTATVLVLLLLSAMAPATAQTVINAYARVTAQSGTALTLSNLSGTFSAGDEALLLQMQDDVIGANTANNASFGNLSSIQSAGLYERVTLTAAGPTSATLSAVPSATFHYSANTRVQLVSFPDLGAGGNFTTTTSLGALAWNGNVGGVLAFRVSGTLTLAHALTADGRGFRGGLPNATSNFVTCDATTYVDNGSLYPYYAFKGEGIYNDNGAYPLGRGHLLTGGGGGNDINGGGGGGGNFTAGGLAGPGWSNGAVSGCIPGAGGGGGAGLSSVINANRVTMGGGGGGGQQNDNLATAGGAGGGLIFVRATVLKTLAGCAGGAISISANGTAAANGGNDGIGGGGAGGAIVLQMRAYNLAGACPLNLSANGANGGNVGNNQTHGGGGGGGKGAIVLADALTTPNNMSVTINVGQGGANSTGGSSANPGDPSATTPLFLSASRPLPVVLTTFAAAAEGRATLLRWATASERNNDRFEVERARSSSPATYERIGTLAGAGTSASTQTYAFRDAVAPAGTCYYRLRQVDADGTASYSPVRAVQRASASAEGLALYPNPAQASVVLDLSGLAPDAPAQAAIRDLTGRELLRLALPAGTLRPTLDLQKLPAGLYQVLVEQAGRRYVQRLTKE